MSSFVFIFKVLTEFQVTEVIGRHLCRNTDHNIWETKRKNPEGRVDIFLFRDDLENYTSFCSKNLLCWQIFVKMWVQPMSFILADIQSKVHLHKTNANLPFHYHCPLFSYIRSQQALLVMISILNISDFLNHLFSVTTTQFCPLPHCTCSTHVHCTVCTVPQKQPQTYTNG